MELDADKEIFFSLLKAGLWEWEVKIPAESDADWGKILRLAEEQSVVGLITAGLEHLDVRCQKEDGSGILSQEDLLQFIGQALQIEQQNRAMKKFIAELVNNMRQKGIYTLLVKGQAVAQCYERPLWRTCGDVDLFLNDENYNKAKELLLPSASYVEEEHIREKHLGMTIDGWVVELHGSLRCGLSKGIDMGLDELQKSIFYGGTVRSWTNGGTQVFLPRADEDAIYVFTHILEHFYKGGIGLRQICDWCRLLYTYKETLNHRLLESRIEKMGLMTEWKTFGAVAVKYLGMPKEVIPLLESSNVQELEKFKGKADRIMEFVMMSGNFGHNRDMSYYSKYPYLMRKCISMGRRMSDLFRHARIFPMDSFLFSFSIINNGIRSAVRGE